MMKNRAPDSRSPAKREKRELCSRIHATRLDCVFFELSVEEGHETGRSADLWFS